MAEPFFYQHRGVKESHKLQNKNGNQSEQGTNTAQHMNNNNTILLTKTMLK